MYFLIKIVCFFQFDKVVLEAQRFYSVSRWPPNNVLSYYAETTTACFKVRRRTSNISY